MKQKNDCCSSQNQGLIKKGILIGLLPHSFCILFILGSIIGATTITGLMKNWLLTPYFFEIIIILSILLSIISSVIYLKTNQSLSFEGVKRYKKYLIILFSSIIATNLLFFLVIFPMVSNYSLARKYQNNRILNNQSVITISVNIPCSGHAPLIMEELYQIQGIININYRLPNIFTIIIDPKTTSVDEILELKIFKSYPAQTIN